MWAFPRYLQSTLKRLPTLDGGVSRTRRVSVGTCYSIYQPVVGMVSWTAARLPDITSKDILAAIIGYWDSSDNIVSPSGRAYGMVAV